MKVWAADSDAVVRLDRWNVRHIDSGRCAELPRRAFGTAGKSQWLTGR